MSVRWTRKPRLLVTCSAKMTGANPGLSLGLAHFFTPPPQTSPRHQFYMHFVHTLKTKQPQMPPGTVTSTQNSRADTEKKTLSFQQRPTRSPPLTGQDQPPRSGPVRAQSTPGLPVWLWEKPGMRPLPGVSVSPESLLCSLACDIPQST